MSIGRVVVTGGCGFLGQYITYGLTRALPEATIDVIDLRANPYSVFDWAEFPRVNVLLGVNICDPSALKSVLDGADLVVHAAGMVSFSLSHRKRLFRVHEQGTESIFAACAANGVARIVHVSSVAALGFGKDRHEWMNEKTEFDWRIAERRHKYYMISKRRADLIAHQHLADGMDVRIAYPSLMYGPGDASNSVHVIRAIQRKEIPFVMPGGNAVSDVRDVADGIINICMNGPVGEDYVLAAHNFSSEELFGHLGEVLNVTPPTRTLPTAFGTILYHTFLVSERMIRKPVRLSADSIDSAFRYRYFDAAKARSQLGWSPRSFDVTLRDTTAWLREHDLIA